MLLLTAILSGLMFCWGIWYWLWIRHNRGRAAEVLRWIESALGGHGVVMGIRWLNRSHFRVPLRLATGVFQRAWVVVELAPRESPWKWTLSRFKRKHELLKFQADLDLSPAFYRSE